MKKTITLSHIAAVSQNHVIGTGNDLPWSIPEDLKYYKEKTKGKIIIMGRKTFDSLGKPLPNRLNIVVTRCTDYQPKGTIVFNSVMQAINYSQQKDMIKKYGKEVFIIGGGEIFKQTLDMVDRLYITRIYKDYEGDSFYPEIPEDQFKEVKNTKRTEPVPFAFLVFDRIKEAPPAVNPLT